MDMESLSQFKIVPSTLDCNLLIVEDEDVLRKSLCDFFELCTTKTYSASTGSEAWNLIRKVPIDVIVTDIRMPEMDGIQLVKNMRNLGNQTPVIFISAFADKEKALTAIKLGAVDFLEKPLGPVEIRDAIQKALSLIREPLTEKLSKLGFSARQIQILKMIAQGATNKSIAKELKISEAGTKYHIGGLLKAFHLTNRKELQLKLHNLY